MMAYLINKARAKQHSAIITLLDLKNAFGEVHHNLIKSVLAYHHVPEAIQSVVTSLYTDFHSYTISDGFSTPAIPFKRGVLQGDCLCPLLFNMCFNTFMQFVKQEKYNQLGFPPHDETDRLFHPVHWFQFADDAAVITTNERENQLLLNCFSRWCQWACMLIRVDKCITFEIKKFSTSSLQFQPKLFINSKIVPPVTNGESFKYNLSAAVRIMSGRRLSPVIIQGDRKPGRSEYNFDEFTDWKVRTRKHKAELCLQVKRPWSRYVLQSATMWSSDSG